MKVGYKRMKLQLTKKLIKSSEKSIWDFGNEVLYKLCAENFYHTNDERILAKVWLIGRAYAAAIERRRIKEANNDDFYIGKVVPAFKNSELDIRLRELSRFDKLTEENLGNTLETHFYFTKLTADLTGLEKRSFCSKYLHFHLPNLFPIYDSRVAGSLRKLISKTPQSFYQLLSSTNIDQEYAKFVCKSIEVRRNVESELGREITLRQFDNLLIDLQMMKE